MGAVDGHCQCYCKEFETTCQTVSGKSCRANSAKHSLRRAARHEHHPYSTVLHVPILEGRALRDANDVPPVM